MTNGGLMMREARGLQKFTGRLRCEAAPMYDGKDPPSCLPVCETCLLKWIEAENEAV